jgi:hypothetical protein
MFHFRRGVGSGRALEALGGEVDVLQIVEVLKNRLAGVEGLGPAGSFGEKGEAVFDFGIEADGEHGGRLVVLYVYSKGEGMLNIERRTSNIERRREEVRDA